MIDDDSEKKEGFAKSFLKSLEQPRKSSDEVCVVPPRVPGRPGRKPIGERPIQPTERGKRIGERYDKWGRVKASKRKKRGGNKHWKVKKKRERDESRRKRALGKPYDKVYNSSYRGRYRRLKYAVSKLKGSVFTLTLEEYMLVWAQAVDVFCPKLLKWGRPWDFPCSGRLKTDGSRIVRISEEPVYSFDTLRVGWYDGVLARQGDKEA